MENQKKGRPTPKRKEAEKQRVIPRLAPAADKATKKLLKEEARKNRIAQRAAFMRGDESALPPRDRGQARRFVRNYIDSRRSIGEFFLPIVMVLLFFGLSPNPQVRLVATIILYGVALYSVIEGFVVGRKIKSKVRDRFPGEPTKGLAVYGWVRSTQIRRLRAPLPQVKRGEKNF
ncbi:MAG: DUF3043 domain-containing protein [Actinobacteria bacterium]|nr:DUF3043 domain-containing protein [Actinomycetota bacterium]